jgi:hypothetical protein
LKAETEFLKPQPRFPVDQKYLYREVIKYIEDKYEIDTRDYKPLKNRSRMKMRDFWHWMMDVNYNVSNGCPIEIPEEWEEMDLESCPQWAREIIALIIKEFPDIIEVGMWASW